MPTIQEIREAVEAGKAKAIKSMVQEALDDGIEPTAILNDGLIKAMAVVGEKFQQDIVFVPDMLISAKAMKFGIEVLKPHMPSCNLSNYGKYIIGTVAGDLHDIGKNLVALMVENTGFEVIDLGVDVPSEAFVEAIQDNPDCKLVGLSALLSTTLEGMEDTVKAITAAGLRSQVKIMVGGAPVTAEFAERIGADAYTADAGSAAQKAKELMVAHESAGCTIMPLENAV
ncbi:MAG: corrinoid protein [Oscillospiraceae bacterium]|nr:corrinoid protein [Oscillospiraceae bacterium]